MKNLTLMLAIGMMVALGLGSCNKKEVVPPPSNETFSSLSDYFNSRQVGSETFTMVAQNGATYTTAKGSKITIPPYAFSYANGTLVTGTVTIKVKEIFSNAEMINSRIFPISNGNVLNSGGEFYIKATQNGIPLRVADGAFIEMDIPAQAEDPGMLLFFAGPNEELDSVNWQIAPQDSLSMGSGFVFNSTDGTYECNLDSLGWGNIDCFNPSVNYFNCEFQLTGVSGLNGNNTNGFAVFKNQNAVWPVGTDYWGSISNNVITESHLADVPLNLLVISVVNGQLYYGVLDITPSANQSYTIQMNATTSSALDAIINALP